MVNGSKWAFSPVFLCEEESVSPSVPLPLRRSRVSFTQGNWLVRRIPLPHHRPQVFLAQGSRLVRRVPLSLRRSMGSLPWETISPSDSSASSQISGFLYAGEPVST